METLTSAFGEQIKQAVSLSKSSTVITEQNVFQEANPDILPLLDQMVVTLALPGSRLSGLEHLEELLEKAQSGASCLLFVEHYSNLDLSLFSYLVRHSGGRGKEISDALVAIAGMKLNEENPVVSALASAYTKIVIYPSRSLIDLDAKKNRAEIIRSNAINRAAMKALLDIKTKGRIILIFPSGTRYRPWDPATKRGVREIDSYVKSFDYFCPVAINGEVLHVRPGDMMEDSVSRDLILVTAGPVKSCAEFRETVRKDADAADGGAVDKKQAVVDAIMAVLEEMHNAAEIKRELLLKNQPTPPRNG
ncbi:MAG: 1-acyl-sn-glycerol-3-phosphate acyltransferase [Treponema sp.]|nr:1-acyl-sn-glycerol-3-phosphate acyltransferase [Treponema sp.]